VIIADGVDGGLYRYNTTGTRDELAVGDFTAVAVDSATGANYAADSGTGDIDMFNAQGLDETIYATGVSTENLAFGPNVAPEPGSSAFFASMAIAIIGFLRRKRPS
jgi:hypothetical protein